MRDTIKTGMTASRQIVVDTPRTIDFLGENLRVYATPELVRDFEVACREFLLDHTDAGEDSVGTGISVTHGGATLRGMSVDITITVAKIEGRGNFIDTRYPHNTAVLQEKATGVKWSVDSWMRHNGDIPEVMTLKRWFKEGYS